MARTLETRAGGQREAAREARRTADRLAAHLRDGYGARRVVLAGSLKKECALELRLFALGTLLKTATREGVWRETCARLGIPGFRQG